ncbi:protein EMSY-LIKE 4 isoform X1 [Ricinus communis]|uniref:protein EMSY-LIKE 4 isoform X1 n=2 Tax=Ricinus communis TaxID=3988 RepID=UPI00201A4410|nr:protein EMSY-LIKE 4 isoform X1 [Ricinus communis]
MVYSFVEEMLYGPEGSLTMLNGSLNYQFNHVPSLFYTCSVKLCKIMMHNLKTSPHGHISGTPRIPLPKEPCEGDEMDIKFQIHSLETEAYYSVLRAFIAQSDLLSWGKEGLITELRKELNVTDIEHSQLLAKINSDESTKRIRELRNGAHESMSIKMNAPDLVNNSVDDALPTKRRPSRPPLLKPQKYVPYDQPYSATIPSLPQTHFRDNRQHGETTAFSPTVSLKIVNHNFQGPLSNKDGGPSQSHMKNSFQTSDVGKSKKSSEFIKIRATDMVIQEVKRMTYGRNNPDPAQVEKAKLILREHERDILGALDKLADLPDQDDSPNLVSYADKELHRNRRRMLASSEYHGQVVEAGEETPWTGAGFITIFEAM